MMCFRDMSFCDSDCSNIACNRNYSRKQAQDAREWWGKDDPPVMFSPEFRENCHDYVGMLQSWS